MDLSVIITTKDREALLSETLESLYQDKGLKKLDFEVLVINDGEKFKECFEQKYGLTVLKNRGQGLAAGRNTGALASSGKVIVFFDDDILAEENHFNRHIEIHKAFPSSIITANRFYPEKIITEGQKTPFGRYKLIFEYDWLNGLERQPIEGHEGLYFTTALAGFSCSMQRETYHALGGFNEEFPYAGCEDNEFFYRASQQGIKLIFDEKNICYHNEFDNFTLEKWIQRQVRGIKGAIVITNLHPEGKEHPTYYLNTPFNAQDSFPTKVHKLKRRIFANSLIKHLVKVSIKALEKLHFPDPVLFKLYNALWIGETYKSFKEAYYKNQYSG